MLIYLTINICSLLLHAPKKQQLMLIYRYLTITCNCWFYIIINYTTPLANTLHHCFISSYVYHQAVDLASPTHLSQVFRPGARSFDVDYCIIEPPMGIGLASPTHLSQVFRPGVPLMQIFVCNFLNKICFKDFLPYMIVLVIQDDACQILCQKT